MRDTAPQTIYLKDYQPTPYLIDKVDLHFEIGEEHTVVTATQHYRKNPKSTVSGSLKLNGEHLRLRTLMINDQKLETEQYKVNESSLELRNLPESFHLTVVTEIEPDKNNALEGLYRAGSILCTQNEAEGFRRITYFLDRPDVMAVYTTTIVADQKKYPVLLSNGNLVASSTLPDGKHQVTWHDPFPKPCYLYALVAGDLAHIEDRFRTRSGRDVRLQIFVESGNENRCAHAMESLKRSMKWDEERFGLEYDLDIYMIVAVDRFNAGAMENKGLNIFNSKYILANEETATDAEYIAIESVIGHEYFHNWTGNRVTCRDWFQLSLKEGLTVFRDQEFTSDMHSRGVKRLDDVNSLRTFQFAEDAGPMAHPVRPASYMEVNNFYTLTVYEKGAEVVRMIHTLLGEAEFQKGIQKYFELFDGQAVTTEDFVHAMEVASGKDLSQFKNWYDQAGTPAVRVRTEYQSSANTLKLMLSQTCPPTPGQSEKKPFQIPVKIALLNPAGEEMPLTLGKTPTATDPSELVLDFREAEQTFVFQNVTEKPVVSIFRGFSAPVQIEFERPDEDLIFLFRNDRDPFTRWEAGQCLILQEIRRQVDHAQKKGAFATPASFIEIYGELLKDESIDPHFKAHLLQFPLYRYIEQFYNPVDPDLLSRAREHLISSVAQMHESTLWETYERMAVLPENLDPIGVRALKNTVLQILRRLRSKQVIETAWKQFDSAENMTDRMGGLSALNQLDCPERNRAFDDFYKRFEKDALTMDKWLGLQAESVLPGALERIRNITKDPIFDIRTPNRVYSLLVRFAGMNETGFHDPSGASYEFIADRVLEIDQFNPQVAARLVSTFNQWRRYEPQRRDQMRKQLQRIVDTAGLSENTYEIASKALANPG